MTSSEEDNITKRDPALQPSIQPENIGSTAGSADKTLTDPAFLPKTTGEKVYGALKFMTGEVFILGATAAIAYIARYGKKSSWNVFQRFQDWFENDLLTKKIPLKTPEPKGKLAEIGNLAATAAANTMVTFHGGNLFAPFMKWFANNKDNMVHYFNKRFGKPGEVEIGDTRMKAELDESWGDVIKGRLVAWGIVFSSFFAAMVLVGKDKNGMYRFDKYEEKFGRWLAGFTKEGKAIAQIPVTQKLHPDPHPNKTYRFGRILALDIYATTAGLIIWNAISRLSANKRQRKKGISLPSSKGADPLTEAPDASLLLEEPCEFPPAADGITPEKLPRKSYAEVAPQPASSHREMVHRQAESAGIAPPAI